MTIAELFSERRQNVAMRASEAYESMYRSLAEDAAEAAADGLTNWAAELRTFAAIALIASRAELEQEQGPR